MPLAWVSGQSTSPLAVQADGGVCAFAGALRPSKVLSLRGSSSAGRVGESVRRSGGIQLYVEETGNPEGRPILFIHGFSQSRLAWSK
jgi:hypothetical protein